MKNIGQRPSPEKISFADECFRVIGKKTFFTVSNGNGWGYPRRFETKAEANANRHGEQVVHEHEELVKERIKWSV